MFKPLIILALATGAIAQNASTSASATRANSLPSSSAVQASSVGDDPNTASWCLAPSDATKDLNKDCCPSQYIQESLDNINFLHVSTSNISCILPFDDYTDKAAFIECYLREMVNMTLKNDWGQVLGWGCAVVSTEWLNGRNLTAPPATGQTKPSETPAPSVSPTPKAAGAARNAIPALAIVTMAIAALY